MESSVKPDTPEPPDDRAHEADAFTKMGDTRVFDEDADTGESTPPAGAPVLTDKTSETVVGDFCLLEKLGEGAMGAVYRAKQISFDRIVAFKLLFAHVANHPNLVERLYREGRVLGQLDHPNIIQAYGVGECRGSHYVAMEFIEGKNLQSWLAKLGRLPIADAVHIVLAIARALDYAHAQGIIHRDIKPENVLITKDGQVKVGDFGMVKVGGEEMDLTQTGHALGTPWYMPLEQARNAKDIDGRSDIFSLGCVLYCLITGQPPFRGQTLVDVIDAKERGVFPPARSIEPEVPQRLDLLILKMCAKAPKNRYQNCAEVIRDLEALGLASEKLTFLQPGAGSSSVRAKTKLKPSATMAEDAAVDPNIWYLRFPSSTGELQVRKLTTEQVQALLQSNKLSRATPISHDSQTGFRALSTYKEFAAIVSKAGVNPNPSRSDMKYRSLYKKIQEEDQKREENKPPQPTYSNTSYWIEFAIQNGKYPFLVVLILAFLWWVVRGLMG